MSAQHWGPGPEGIFEDKWALYGTRKDFGLANDLAGQIPQKPKELQDLFMQEAVKYNVLPIDDRGVERYNPAPVWPPHNTHGL